MARHICRECARGFPRKSDLSRTSKLCNDCSVLALAESCVMQAIPGTTRWVATRDATNAALKRLPIDPNSV